METIVVVAQHRNQYYNRSKSHISDHLVSSPSRSFKRVNCRAFHSSPGVLPSPPSFANISDPKSARFFYSEPTKQGKRNRSFTLSPSLSPKVINFTADISCSELWAGPAYSNSPPPSSVPIPKFSLRPRRSISLELPLSEPEVVVPAAAKSAPSSPTREPADGFFLNTLTATENLRRILHLDIADH